MSLFCGLDIIVGSISFTFSACKLGRFPTLQFPSYSKTCVKRPLKNTQNKDLNDRRSKVLTGAF